MCGFANAPTSFANTRICTGTFSRVVALSSTTLGRTVIVTGALVHRRDNASQRSYPKTSMPVNPDAGVYVKPPPTVPPVTVPCCGGVTDNDEVGVAEVVHTGIDHHGLIGVCDGAIRHREAR